MADPKQTGVTSGSGLRPKGAKQRVEDLSNYVFGKVQPQAVPLEEAVLGALMIDKDALSVVLDIIRAESFYLDAHQYIFQAMLRLFERSQPIDLLTATEELKKSGDLEAVGGPAYLAELTNRVASAANIEYHARIIAQKHIQRELIGVSTKIIRDSFEDTTDVFQLLDDAEQGLFSIAQQNMRRSYESISSLATKAIKQLEELKNKEHGLTGVPTGFTELDRLTSGWQPSDLIIVAARPAMGKTSFVLSMARNAAVDFGKGVALFSLEMSGIQLAQRLISMEAEISGSKMRHAQLEEYEWQQLQSAITRIGEAPIFIDDTAGINVFELRAKCRRMKLQHDIQLIIIDYLQLMSGGADNQRGNREQEVSAISRALKGLAKELNVPVIALSQLSRAVEVRGGTKRPQLSDLRESGCLTGDTLIQDAVTGALTPIKTLAERQSPLPFRTLSMNDDLKLGAHTMTRAFYSGRKPVFELVTRSGRRIKASANHPFYKLSGWAALDQLKVGDHIAIARKINIAQPSNPLRKEELILLAHLIGDGCILPKQPYHYTSADLENINIVEKTASSLFGITTKRVTQKNWWHVYLPSPYRLTHGKKHPITAWYDDLGLQRVRSFDKYLPEKLFECDNQHIGLFLSHLWATDGNISWKRLPGRKPHGAIYYSSSSNKLACQVQYLLNRLDIFSTLRPVKQGKYRDSYHVLIQDKENQLLFLRQVGCYGQRGAIIPELIASLEDILQNTNNDVIPKEAWHDIIAPAVKAKSMSWRKLHELMDLSYSGSFLKTNISRTRLKRLNQFINNPSLDILAESDIYWDQIESILPLGEEDVYDATVEGVHNFLANGIIVHNSIEQDADIVSFIYRPEYYGIMEDEEGHSLKGVSEIIVAKNRHGAAKNVKLRFIEEYARFSDLDDPNFDDLPGDTFEGPYTGVITRPSRMNEDEDIPF